MVLRSKSWRAQPSILFGAAAVILLRSASQLLSILHGGTAFTTTRYACRDKQLGLVPLVRAEAQSGMPSVKSCVHEDDEELQARLFGELTETLEEMRESVLGDSEDVEGLELDDETMDELNSLNRWEHIQLNDTMTVAISQVPSHYILSLGIEDQIRTCGIYVWAGSIALARWLVSEDSRGGLQLGGKRVLEMGAGLGLPTIVSALLGAKQAVAQDVYARPLEEVLHSAEHNRVQEQVATLASDWAELGEKLITTSSQLDAPDVVIGSSILYNDEFSRVAASALAAILRNESQVAYIFDPPDFVSRYSFMEVCQEEGLDVEVENVKVWEPAGSHEKPRGMAEAATATARLMESGGGKQFKLLTVRRRCRA